MNVIALDLFERQFGCLRNAKAKVFELNVLPTRRERMCAERK